MSAELQDETRALVALKLGVSIVERRDESYRSSLGATLDGDWLGAFVQPGVILNAASAMRAAIAGSSGRCVDEYGAATLAVTGRNGDLVEIVKQYSSGETHRFRYVGRLSEGVLAGCWHSTARPAFHGVFWLARKERLEAPSARVLDARVSSRSWRRAVAKLVMLSLVVVAAGGGVTGMWPITAVALAVIALAYAVVYRRARALSAVFAQWLSSLTPVRPS